MRLLKLRLSNWPNINQIGANRLLSRRGFEKIRPFQNTPFHSSNH